MATARDRAARPYLFLAVTRARTRLVMSGVTHDRVAGGDACVAPVEWLRRELRIEELSAALAHYRFGEADVDVRVECPPLT